MRRRIAEERLGSPLAAAPPPPGNAARHADTLRHHPDTLRPQRQRRCATTAQRQRRCAPTATATATARRWGGGGPKSPRFEITIIPAKDFRWNPFSPRGAGGERIGSRTNLRRRTASPRFWIAAAPGACLRQGVAIYAGVAVLRAPGFGCEADPGTSGGPCDGCSSVGRCERGAAADNALASAARSYPLGSVGLPVSRGPTVPAFSSRAAVCNRSREEEEVKTPGPLARTGGFDADDACAGKPTAEQSTVSFPCTASS